MFEIPAGACVATKKKGITGWFLENFFSPRTDRVHHVLIRGYVPEVDDYEFIESIHIGFFGKGIRHGYLFAEYEGIDVEIYTVNAIEAAATKRANAAPLWSSSFPQSERQDGSPRKRSSLASSGCELVRSFRAMSIPVGISIRKSP